MIDSRADAELAAEERAAEARESAALFAREPFAAEVPRRGVLATLPSAPPALVSATAAGVGCQAPGSRPATPASSPSLVTAVIATLVALALVIWVGNVLRRRDCDE